MSKTDYILGSDRKEIERLKFQHEVWKKVTNSLLDKCNIKPGMRCLDAGSGPGFVAFDILELMNNDGIVDALEPAVQFVKYMEIKKSKEHLKNFNILNGDVETYSLQKEVYDIIFSRWVIAFVPDAELFLNKLISSLKPGGYILIMDYAYEGMGLYPSDGFNEIAADAVRKYYKSGRGDLYITTKIPAMFRKYGVELIDFMPICLAGNPESGVFKWAYNFFSDHIPGMADKGIIKKEEADKVITDWENKKKDPDSIFFSPLVVGIIGNKLNK